MIRVASSFEMNASAERIINLTSDTARMPVWLPGVTSAEVLAREGDISVIEFCGPRLRTGRLVLECVRTSSRKVIFAEVDRWRGRGFSGSLSVSDRDEDGCVLNVDVQRDGMVFNLVARRRLQRTVEQLVSELAREAERETDSEVEIASGRRKILEIVRRDGKLFVCVDGSTVELPPADGAAEAS